MHFGNKSLKEIRGDGRQNGQREEEERKLTQYEFFEISNNVESYLNDKIDQIELKDLTEAQAYLRAMKDFYSSKMKEYISELNVISNKLKKYEEILAKRRSRATSEASETQGSFVAYDETQNGYNNSYSGQKEIRYGGQYRDVGLKEATNEQRNKYSAQRYQEEESNGYGYNNRQNSKENSYSQQSQKAYQTHERKIGFYNFGRVYQPEAIMETPDENDY